MTIGAGRRVLLALLAASCLLPGCSLLDPRWVLPASDPLEDIPPDWRVTDVQELVVSAAAGISRAADLHEVYGGFLFRSCSDGGEPPHQGIVEMSFAVPADVGPRQYLQQVADAMVAYGWDRWPSPGMKPFRVVINLPWAFVTAVMTSTDDPRWAKIRVSGECLHAADHRPEKTSWVDVTYQLTAK